MTVDRTGEIGSMSSKVRVFPESESPHVPVPRESALAEPPAEPLSRPIASLPPAQAETSTASAPAAEPDRQSNPELTHLSAVQRKQTRKLLIADLAVIWTTVVVLLIVWEPLLQIPSFGHQPQTILAAALIVLWPLTLAKMRAYAPCILGHGPEEYRRVLIASAITTGIVGAAAYLAETTGGRKYLGATMLLGTLALLVTRHLLRCSLLRWLSTGAPLQHVFILADAR
ncbi:MAG: hypothetical protein U0904_04885, partial [Candidatus Nanopelagicales bacterium]|nr:hypothetical protein [Candidatus Nanopelagicales bacterium]